MSLSGWPPTRWTEFSNKPTPNSSPYSVAPRATRPEAPFIVCWVLTLISKTTDMHWLENVPTQCQTHQNLVNLKTCELVPSPNSTRNAFVPRWRHVPRIHGDVPSVHQKLILMQFHENITWRLHGPKCTPMAQTRTSKFKIVSKVCIVLLAVFWAAEFNDFSGMRHT